MRCVETYNGAQCENEEPCNHVHWNRFEGSWSAASRYCGHDTIGNTSCVRDIDHDGECRPRGWINTAQPTKRTATDDVEYALWAGALIGTLIAIVQLAAERANPKKDGNRFSWIEVD